MHADKHKLRYYSTEGGSYICKLHKSKRKRACANAPKSPYKCVATDIRETNISIIRNCEDILHAGLLQAHPHHNKVQCTSKEVIHVRCHGRAHLLGFLPIRLSHLSRCWSA